MSEERMNVQEKSLRATVTTVGDEVLFSLSLFFESILDWLCWLIYELRLSRKPVFLTQKQEPHFRKTGHWLWEHRHVLGPTAILFALVVADLSLDWSTAAAQLFGLKLLWATVEQFLDVLLPIIAVVIPLAILALTFARSELGPNLTDLLILRLKLFALLALGMCLAIALAFIVPQGFYSLNVLGEDEPNMWVHRLAIWSLLGILAFGALLLTWVAKVRACVISHRRFALVADFARREYRAARHRDLNRYLELTEQSIRAIGLSFVTLSTRATGRPGVESTRSGSVLDINLRRLGKLVSKMKEFPKDDLVLVVWPGSYVTKGDPLIRIRGESNLDRRACLALRSCFRIIKVPRRQRRSSYTDALELVTRTAFRSVDDPAALEKWIDLLGRLAEPGDWGGLEFGIYRAFSQIVSHVARHGNEEAQSRLAWQFYQLSLERLHKGDYGAVQGYVQLLAWLFKSALPVRAERGIQHSVYYILFLGSHAVEHVGAHPDEKVLKGLLAVLGEIAWQSAEMAAAALTEGRTKLAHELRLEIQKLVRGEAGQLLYSRKVDDDEGRAARVDEHLRAHFEASGFFLGALLLRRALQGSLDPVAAAEGLSVALSWARTPAELFAALERIEAHGLWKGLEHFQEREIMSPLGEFFWGDDRAPFLEVYILGSAVRAHSSTDWPKESKFLERVWPTLQILCMKMKSELVRYKAIVPQLTEGVLEDFEAVHRKLVHIWEERTREEIARAPLSQKAVAEFVKQAIESFRMNSILWLCFDIVASQKMLQRASPARGRTIEAKGPKEAFIEEKVAMFVAPGDLWAAWNDTVCLYELRDSLPVQGVFEEMEEQLTNLSPQPEIIFVSPKARPCIARSPGFCWPIAKKREKWTGRALLMGLWQGRPVLGVSSIPENEAWLLNISDACELIEYTEAVPRVEVSPNRPLEVVITFPQRLEFRLLNRAGAIRLQLGSEWGADRDVPGL